MMDAKLATAITRKWLLIFVCSLHFPLYSMERRNVRKNRIWTKRSSSEMAALHDAEGHRAQPSIWSVRWKLNHCWVTCAWHKCACHNQRDIDSNCGHVWLAYRKTCSLLCETHKDHFACQYKTRKTWIHFTLLCSSKLTNGKEGATRIRKQLRYSRTHSFVSRTRVMLSKIILPQNSDGLVVINDDQRINLSCLFPWKFHVASQDHLCHMTDKWPFLTNHD